MDGASLKRSIRQLLNEDSDSGWLDTRSTFDFLYEAATDFTERTHCLKGSQEITTVADQTDYDLNADFLRLYLKNSNNDLLIKWGDDNFIKWTDYGKIQYRNRTDSVNIPDGFTITNASLPDQATGTATSTGASTGGKSTLVDSAGDFTDVYLGGSINNTTDGSAGVVVAINSTTSIDVALFDGTANDWTIADAYVIQPQSRYKIVLDPPPDSAETITVSYVKKPIPVYSDYQAYEIPNQFAPALIKYAFWLYKYRDKDPNFGDGMYRYYDNAVRNANSTINQALNRKVSISFKASK